MRKEGVVTEEAARSRRRSTPPAGSRRRSAAAPPVVGEVGVGGRAIAAAAFTGGEQPQPQPQGASSKDSFPRWLGHEVGGPNSFVATTWADLTRRPNLLIGVR